MHRGNHHPGRILRTYACAAADFFLVSPLARAGADGEKQRFATDVRPLLLRFCGDCHSDSQPKKNFRIDDLPETFATEAARKRWSSVARRIKSREMPPRDAEQPSAEERRGILAWIEDREREAAARQRDAGRATWRRLNRVEYENTVRDLLRINVELKELLPLDSSSDGFDHVADAQHTSSFLLERYLEAADQALALAVVDAPQPPVVRLKISCNDTHTLKSSTERVYRKNGDAVTLFSSSVWNAVTVSPFYPPHRGRYRFRIYASAVQSGDRPVTFRVEGGPMLMGTKNHLIDFFDAPPGETRAIEFVDHLEARSTIRIQPFGLATAHVVNKIGADAYEGPGLSIDRIEVEGPLHEIWPPESHRSIFGDLPQEKRPIRDRSDRLEVVSAHPEEDTERILRGFASRAFRRPVTDAELQPLLELCRSKRESGGSFESAVRVGLKRVLVSPQFLFLREKPGPLDDYALASRLSYFLWSTMPDEPLLAAAAAGKLHEPAELRAQVERLLADRRSVAFTENFCGQWLGLRDLDFTEPDRRLYPEYDALLRTAMLQEPQFFFREVLQNDLSLTNFVASDFTFLNERLAKHYGIEGVTGHAMRKTPLPPDSRRGGVMTMAGVLKVTANGTNTSPVVRGAWVLSRILGRPPEPPPAEVPAIEPDIRGATTIREQLAKHRDNASCAVCHVKIDPLGFALESFDVIGGYREHYRSIGNVTPVVRDGQRMPYAQGLRVEPADILDDGRRFSNIDELKALLAEDKEQLARAFADKLVTYATGRAPQPADEPQMAALIAEIRGKNYGLRSLVHAVVQSPLFTHK